MVELLAEDLEVSVYPEPPSGGMQTGRIPVGVKISHKPTGITTTCVENRQQFVNRQLALAELEKLVNTYLKQNKDNKGS